MEQKDFPNWVRVIAVIGIIILCFFSIKKQKRKTNELNIRGRYTIGETKGWSHNIRSSDYDINFTYKFNSVEYRKFMSEPSLSKIDTRGGKYIVVFDPESPRNSIMLFDMKVKEYYGSIDDSGWIKLPKSLLIDDLNDRD